jgi:hypothetical protein
VHPARACARNPPPRAGLSGYFVKGIFENNL